MTFLWPGKIDSLMCGKLEGLYSLVNFLPNIRKHSFMYMYFLHHFNVYVIT